MTADVTFLQYLKNFTVISDVCVVVYDAGLVSAVDVDGGETVANRRGIIGRRFRNTRG
jgi:hypothetical protein